MQFATSKQFSKEILPNPIITYIDNREGSLIEVKAHLETEDGLNLKTIWMTYQDPGRILNCYNLITKEIESYYDGDYVVAMKNLKEGQRKSFERKISSFRLKKTLNPLTLTRKGDIGLGINSTHGAFWFCGEDITQGAEQVTIVSPFNISKLVSQIALETGLVDNYQRQDMETILDLTYDYYLNENRSKLTWGK